MWGSILIEIYNTDQEVTRACDLLGTIKLACIVPSSSYKTDSEVSFHIDASGILTADVTEASVFKWK
jgi:molecular chaperone DnaK (HSP70)